MRDFIELLESAFAFRFDRDSYLLVQRELRNEGKDADAARVFDMLRSRDTAIIRQWGERRANYFDSLRQVFQSPLWPITACFFIPYFTLAFVFQTVLVVPVIRLWTTLAERALFGNFLHAGRPLLWALMALWFALSVSIFLNPQNIATHAVSDVAYQGRSPSLSDAVWVSIRYHIPPIGLAIRPSIMPSSEPLRSPTWFIQVWNWCTQHGFEHQFAAGWAYQNEDGFAAATRRKDPFKLLAKYSNRDMGARSHVVSNNSKCRFPTCWNTFTPEDYAGITELVHWILVPLLLTIWVATVVQRRSSAMGN